MIQNKTKFSFFVLPPIIIIILIALALLYNNTGLLPTIFVAIVVLMLGFINYIKIQKLVSDILFPNDFSEDIVKVELVESYDLSELINKECSLTISEPWEFGTINGCGPWDVKIIDMFNLEGFKFLVLYSNSSFDYKEKKFNFMAFQSRHEGSGLVTLFENKQIAINLDFLSIDTYSQNEVIEYIKNDRSGFGGIGSIQLKK